MTASKTPHPAADLFGEVPVTWPEVYDWMRENVPRWAGTRRENWYIANWNVIEKVRRDKSLAFMSAYAAKGRINQQAEK